MESKLNNYKLFEHWYKLLDWILQTCDKMPKNIRFTISQRIINLSLDNLQLLIKAVYNKDRKESLMSFNFNLEQLRIFFRLSKDRTYISLKQFEYIINQLNEAGKMCGGWIKNENTQ